MMLSVSVVIPARNRPDKLRKCLEALETALPLSRVKTVHVCDSSTTAEMRKSVAEVCASYHWVHLVEHDKVGASAARNVCAQVASEDLLVTVDDDVYVRPDALRRLIERYDSEVGPCVIAGSVRWDDWSRPVVMRSIGYGRSANVDEKPSFLVSAFLIYPRSFAIAWPWNERIMTSEDRFMGALWRSRNIRLLYEPEARADHDSQRTVYNVKHYHDHIYANLFDALIANPDWRRALGYEFLGFALGLRSSAKKPARILPFLKAWGGGHAALVRDWQFLKTLVAVRTP